MASGKTARTLLASIRCCNAARRRRKESAEAVLAQQDGPGEGGREPDLRPVRAREGVRSHPVFLESLKETCTRARRGEGSGIQAGIHGNDLYAHAKTLPQIEEVLSWRYFRKLQFSVLSQTDGRRAQLLTKTHVSESEPSSEGSTQRGTHRTTVSMESNHGHRHIEQATSPPTDHRPHPRHRPRLQPPTARSGAPGTPARR